MYMCLHANSPKKRHMFPLKKIWYVCNSFCPFYVNSMLFFLSFFSLLYLLAGCKVDICVCLTICFAYDIRFDDTKNVRAMDEILFFFFTCSVLGCLDTHFYLLLFCYTSNTKFFFLQFPFWSFRQQFYGFGAQG